MKSAVEEVINLGGITDGSDITDNVCPKYSSPIYPMKKLKLKKNHKKALTIPLAI
jgi:hypothetical protein